MPYDPFWTVRLNAPDRRQLIGTAGLPVCLYRVGSRGTRALRVTTSASNLKFANVAFMLFSYRITVQHESQERLRDRRGGRDVCKGEQLNRQIWRALSIKELLISF